MLTIALTPEQWQDYVVSCEIGCRMDYGVDADGEGDGLLVAIDDLDETMATMDPDEDFVVFDGRTPGRVDPRQAAARARRREASASTRR